MYAHKLPERVERTVQPGIRSSKFSSCMSRLLVGQQRCLFDVSEFYVATVGSFQRLLMLLVNA